MHLEPTRHDVAGDIVLESRMDMRLVGCQALKCLLDRGLAHTRGRRTLAPVEDRILGIQGECPRHIPSGEGLQVVLHEGRWIGLGERPYLPMMDGVMDLLTTGVKKNNCGGRGVSKIGCFPCTLQADYVHIAVWASVIAVHRITSSARLKRPGGMVMPRAWAALSSSRRLTSRTMRRCACGGSISLPPAWCS